MRGLVVLFLGGPLLVAGVLAAAWFCAASAVVALVTWPGLILIIAFAVVAAVVATDRRRVVDVLLNRKA